MRKPSDWLQHAFRIQFLLLLCGLCLFKESLAADSTAVASAEAYAISPIAARRSPGPALSPIVSLGPGPGSGPSLGGPAIHVTLDLFGRTLNSFNSSQQQTLLLVMNDTIADVDNDDLQLMAVEEILPLSGPSAVSVVSRSASSPGSGRRLMGGPLTGQGRRLLQILAQAGNNSNLSSLTHLQASVRISTSLGNADKLKGEVVGAVNGPMLPLLRERGLDIDYLRLASLQVENGEVNATGTESAPHASFPHYAIGIIVAGIVAIALVFVAIFWGRRRRHKQLQLRAKARKDSLKSFTPEGTDFSQQSEALELAGASQLPGLSPPHSAISSLNSLASSSDKQPARGKGTSMWNVPLSELQFSRVIGEGSFGKVYLGKWQETTVAIKILTSPGGPLPDDSWDLQDVTRLKDCSWSTSHQGQSTAQRLLVAELTKESSLMASLRHPNIVLFLGVSLDPPCMLTEFCARGSLLDVLHRARTNKAVAVELDWPRRLRLGLDAAKGMHYLHTRQPAVLHRDLKSANLLVDKHWQAKVADFNLSRVMQPSAAVSSLAATNPRWLPPEVLSGKGYDSSADVYAFGIILWELLTWQVPWQDETPWQVVISVVDHDCRPELLKEPEYLGGIPAAYTDYIALMQQCWSTSPQKRPTYEAIIGQMRALIDAENGIAWRPNSTDQHTENS